MGGHLMMPGTDPGTVPQARPQSERFLVSGFEFKEERKRQENNRTDSYTKHTKQK